MEMGGRMKLLLLGLLLTSSAFAQTNDLRIEIERGNVKTIDPAYLEKDDFSMLNIDFEHGFKNNLYMTMGMSSGSGTLSWLTQSKKTTLIGSSPREYIAFKVGIGIRF